MKQLAALILTLTYLTCHAQNEVNFNVHLKPEMKYEMHTDESSQTELKYGGPSDMLKKLKEKGISNPTKSTKVTVMETVEKTGKRSAGESFPLTLEFVKMTNNDSKSVIKQGTILYGHSDGSAKQSFDSITAEGMSESDKVVFMQMMESVMEQLKFPAKTLKIGEKFDREQPITMPIAGNTMKMNITSYYKLISIKNGIAHFNITQVYTMSTMIENHNMNATGKGKGYLDYDMANNFYSTFVVDNEMKLGMKLEKLSFSVKLKNHISQQAVMSKN
jgi:hypothetical protein